MERIEEEKETAYCRVCHCESEPDNQLFFPCKCDGSIKYVHQECLEQWLKVSNKHKCELCGEVFHFQKVYKSDAPYHISLLDVFLEVVPRALRMVQLSVVMVISAVLWGVCLPVFTNWWLKTCWCIIVNADGRCLTRAPSFISEGSLEGLVTYWYFGLVNVCIIAAASVVSFEIGHSLYREYLIAKNQHQIRALERRLAQSNATIRYHEVENTRKEQALFAISDYESMKSEWDLSKKKYEDAVLRARQFNAAGGDEPPTVQPGTSTDGTGGKEEPMHNTGDVNGENDREKITDLNGMGLPFRNQMQRVIPSIEDRFVMVQSLANDQVYCTKVVTRLDTVCALTKSPAFGKLRDSFVALEAELIKTNDECAALISLMPSSIVPRKSDIGTKHTYPDMYGRFDEPTLGEGSRAARAHWGRQVVQDDRIGRDTNYWEDRGDDQEDQDELQQPEEDDIPWYERDADVDIDAIEPTVDNLELRANLMLRQRMRDAARAARRRDEPEGVLMSGLVEIGVCEEELAEDGKKGENGLVGDDDVINYRPGIAATQQANESDGEWKDQDNEVSVEEADAGVTQTEPQNQSRSQWEELEDVQCDGLYYQDEPQEPLAEEVVQRDVQSEPQDLPGADDGADARPAIIDQHGEEVAQALDGVITSVEFAEEVVVEEGAPQESRVFAPASTNMAAVGEQNDAPGEGNDVVRNELPIPPVVGAEQPPAVQVPPPNPAAMVAAVPANPVPPLVAPQPGHGRDNNQFSSIQNILAGFAFVVVFVLVALLLPALLGEVFYSYTTLGRSVAQRVQARVLESAESEEIFLGMAKLLEYLEFSTEVIEIDGDRTRTALVVSENVAAVLKVVFGYSFFLTLAVSTFAASYLQFMGGFDYTATALPDFDIVGAATRNVRAAWEMLHSVAKFGVLVSAFGVATPIAMTVLTAKVLNKSLPAYLRTGDLESLSLVLLGALFIFSYMITLHVWYITKELRRAIDRKYLVGILPENDEMDGAHPGPGENTFISLHEKLKKLTYSQIIKRVLIRTSIMIPTYVICVVVPIRFGHLLCPLSGPLMFRLKQVTAEMQIPVEMMLSHIFIPLIIEKMRYKAVVRSVVANFLGLVAPMLGLGWILAVAPDSGAAVAARAVPQEPHALPALVAPAGEAGEEVAGQPRNVEENTTDGTETTGNTAPVVLPPLPPPRASVLSVTALVVAGMVLLAVISSCVLHAPLAAGRWSMEALRLPTHNDMFNYPVGLLLCWGACFVVHYIAQDIARNAGVRSAFAATAKWVLLALKVITVGALWLGLPPMILGILLETLFVAPMRLTVIETPFFPFLQNWALGLIILKAFSKCVINGMFGEIDLRIQMEMVLIRGFANFDAAACLTRIVLPVTLQLLDLLLTPYFLAHCACVFTSSYTLRTMMLRYCYHAYIAVICLGFLTYGAIAALVKLHNEVRDSKYLIGTKLTNRR